MRELADRVFRNGVLVSNGHNSLWNQTAPLKTSPTATSSSSVPRRHSAASGDGYCSESQSRTRSAKPRTQPKWPAGSFRTLRRSPRKERRPAPCQLPSISFSASTSDSTNQRTAGPAAPLMVSLHGSGTDLTQTGFRKRLTCREGQAAGRVDISGAGLCPRTVPKSGWDPARWNFRTISRQGPSPRGGPSPSGTS